MKKDTSVNIRINSDIKKAIDLMDLSVQKIIDLWIEKNLHVTKEIIIKQKVKW